MEASILVVIILALVFGLYMAWGIGANDVANAMGTSVGSGALTLRKAILVAAVLEFGGAFLVGAHVSDTVRQGIVDPEIFAGTVEIKAIAREAGSRTKIAVSSTEEGVDPIGSCVGQKGTRVQAIIDELGGEKIDIIEWNEDPIKFISAALSPAKVLGAELFEEEKRAVVTVPNDQLSLAIGKRGQNVRLAAKLSGWKLDVTSNGEPEAAKEEGAPEEKEEEKEAPSEEAPLVEAEPVTEAPLPEAAPETEEKEA